MDKNIITIQTDVVKKLDITQIYKSIPDLHKMLSSPLNLQEICNYLNYIHNPHNISYSIGKNGTCICVEGESILNFFTASQDGKLLLSNPSYPSINKTLVNQTSIIIKALENRDVRFITKLTKGLHQFYFKTKTGIFLSYSFFGSLNIIGTAGTVALASPTGAAPLTISGVMALSFFFSNGLKAVNNYIPEGKIKNSIRLLTWGSGIPLALAEWTANKLIGPIERMFTKENFDINITQVLGIADGPPALNYTEVFHQLENWTNQGRILYQTLK
jgi:hypothetical protein